MNLKAIDIFKKILKKIEYDDLFLGEDFISNLEVVEAIMELEALEDKDKLAELEKVILDDYLAKGFEVGIGDWGFTVEVKSLYKRKYLRVAEKNGIIIYQGYKDTTKDMFNEAIAHFTK